MYRPPNTVVDTLHILTEYMQQHMHQHNKIILTGDYNLPGITWHTLDSGITDKICAEALLDMAFSFSLKQIIIEPTRVTCTNSNTLDLTFISDNIPLSCSSCEVIEGISDHRATKCSISLFQKPHRGKSTSQIFNWARADDVGILDYLDSAFESFSQRFADRSISVNELWLSFKSITDHCLSAFVPIKTKVVRKTNPWISREILQLKRKISRIRKLRNKAPLDRYSDNIRQLSKTLKDLIKNAKHRYLNVTLNEFIKKSPNKFWHYLSARAHRKSNLPPKDALHKANEFNAYFKSVFTLDDGITPEMSYGGHGSAINSKI